MRRRCRSKLKCGEDKVEEHRRSPVAVVSSDDEEANMDLSLEIVEKAREREAKRKKEEKSSGSWRGIVRLDGADDVSSSSPSDAKITDIDAEDQILEISEKSRKLEANGVFREDGYLFSCNSVEPEPSVQEKGLSASDLKSRRRSLKLKKKEDKAHDVDISTPTKPLDVDAIINLSDDMSEKEALETKHCSLKVPESIEASENIVLRKLLRGPRYFDPPDGEWDTCYNCGQEGHTVANCTEERRKKPCFVCGEFGHGAKHCTQGQDCYICKRRGHIAKNCPDKHQESSSKSKICIRCGSLGHEMPACDNDYSPEDLKGIQCYICKGFGHLCCATIADNGSREVSCYTCGQTGHTGLGCAKVRWNASDASSTYCYRCGEEGHFARGCSNFDKFDRWMGEPSTPSQSQRHPRTDKLCFKSAPADGARTHKRKATSNYERKFKSAGKSKQRGGWTDDNEWEFRTPGKPRQKRGGWIADDETRWESSGKSKKRGAWIVDDETRWESSGKSKQRGAWIVDDETRWESSGKSKQRGAWIADSGKKLRKSNRRGGWIPDDTEDSPNIVQDDTMSRWMSTPPAIKRKVSSVHLSSTQSMRRKYDDFSSVQPQNASSKPAWRNYSAFRFHNKKGHLER